MSETLLLHDKTKQALDHYRALSGWPSVILYGEQGLGKFQTAIRLLKDIKQVEDPETCAQVRIVRPEKGLISKATIQELLEFVEYESQERKFFIIDDANLMNDEAQNCLLKLLEDYEDSCTVILIAHKRLIETIESRCIEIRFGKIAADVFKESIYGQGFSKNLWLASGGIIGTYRKLKNNAFEKKAEEILHAIFYGSSVDVFSVFGLLKEKDKEILTEVFSEEEIEGFLRLIKARLFQAYRKNERVSIHLDDTFLESYMVMLEDAMLLCKKKRFRANELFSVVMKIVERKGDLHALSDHAAKDIS